MNGHLDVEVVLVEAAAPSQRDGDVVARDGGCGAEVGDSARVAECADDVLADLHDFAIS